VSIPARARTLDRRFFGVVEALVSANEDPDHQGRVKVTFPWFDGSETESDWCRVRQLYAGGGYGTFFVPELGDEVLVAFVHGDMRLPVILGGLYNGRDTPPSYRTAEKNEKVIRTKGGHEILLDESSRTQRVRLRTKGGHEILLLDTDPDHHTKLAIHTSGGHKVTLDDEGEALSIETSGHHKITLDDKGQALSVETGGHLSLRMDDAGQSIQITAGATTVSMDGQGGSIRLAAQTVTIAADSLAVNAGSISLGDGAAHPLVFGDSLLALFNSHTHNATSLGAPTSQPLPQMTPADLSIIGKTG
jgi:uncharacterized protein involved in type VI secretion and phage assembly